MRVNCHQCGKFMKKAELEEHPTVFKEMYQRYECECGGVNHVYQGKSI